MRFTQQHALTVLGCKIVTHLATIPHAVQHSMQPKKYTHSQMVAITAHIQVIILKKSKIDEGQL